MSKFSLFKFIFLALPIMKLKNFLHILLISISSFICSRFIFSSYLNIVVFLFYDMKTSLTLYLSSALEILFSVCLLTFMIFLT